MNNCIAVNQVIEKLSMRNSIWNTPVCLFTSTHSIQLPKADRIEFIKVCRKFWSSICVFFFRLFVHIVHFLFTVIVLCVLLLFEMTVAMCIIGFSTLRCRMFLCHLFLATVFKVQIHFERNRFCCRKRISVSMKKNNQHFYHYNVNWTNCLFIMAWLIMLLKIAGGYLQSIKW